MIKIAIIDDHPAIVIGVAKMLQQYDFIKITGTYLSAEELLSDIEIALPDIILLDVQMPKTSGDKLTQQILKRYPAVKIIVFTNYDSPFYMENMMRLGAKGYLLKSSPEGVIIESILEVNKGELYVSNLLKEKIDQINNFKNRMAKSRLSLTDRESQILQLIADGYTTQEIAGKLFLSFHTIENYRDNILMKLDVKNTASLVKKSVLLGLIK